MDHLTLVTLDDSRLLVIRDILVVLKALFSAARTRATSTQTSAFIKISNLESHFEADNAGIDSGDVHAAAARFRAFGYTEPDLMFEKGYDHQV